MSVLLNFDKNLCFRHLIVQSQQPKNRAMCAICSKLTVKTQTPRQYGVSTLKFQQVNAGWFLSLFSTGVLH